MGLTQMGLPQRTSINFMASKQKSSIRTYSSFKCRGKGFLMQTHLWVEQRRRGQMIKGEREQLLNAWQKRGKSKEIKQFCKHNILSFYIFCICQREALSLHLLDFPTIVSVSFICLMLKYKLHPDKLVIQLHFPIFIIFKSILLVNRCPPERAFRYLGTAGN